LRVVILPFEDLRSEKGRFGTRTHLWGGETYFAVGGGKPGEVVAHALAEFLRERGWTVSEGRAAAAGATAAADVTINGQITDFTVHAKSRVFSTKMTVRLTLAVQALNAADRSTARLTVSGARTDSEMWFEPEVLAAVVDATLYDSFQKLLAGTKVEGWTLQIK
jgi:hypothetical protein